MHKKELSELQLEKQMKFIQIPGPNPILTGSAPGAWDEHNLEACNVFKDGEIYYLYYHAQPKDSDRWPHLGYRLGVATAPHPLGPWTKYENNQVIQDFGYVGGVVKVDGKYRMYNEYPISDSSPDQGPFALATADKPCATAEPSANG